MVPRPPPHAYSALSAAGKLMPDVTVQRHGDRWAVVPADAESAVSEFPTREAAELAAKGLAQGGRVEIREDDPSGLDEAGPTEPEGATEPDLNLVDAQERARSTQSGL